MIEQATEVRPILLNISPSKVAVFRVTRHGHCRQAPTSPAMNVRRRMPSSRKGALLTHERVGGL